MTDAATSSPTWGYRPNGEARIFDLGPGEKLPEGWHASPTVIADPALATAEALSAAAARSAAADREKARLPTKPPTVDADADRPELIAENARLRAENARLRADLALLREQIAQVGADLIRPPRRNGASASAADGAATAPEGAAIVGNRPIATIESPAAVTGENPAPADAAEVSARSDENPAGDQASRSPDPGTGSAPVQVGQPRNREETRDAVRALLGDRLSDREIARRVGVSPSTVAAVRKQTA